MAERAMQTEPLVQREQAGQTTEYASVEVQADDGKIA
jgi:hypothetical protein